MDAELASAISKPLPAGMFAQIDAAMAGASRFVDLIGSLYTPAFALARRWKNASCICNDVSGSVYAAITRLSEAFLRLTIWPYAPERLSEDVEVEIVANMLGAVIDRIDALCAVSVYSAKGTVLLLRLPLMPVQMYRRLEQHVAACIASVNNSQSLALLVVPKNYAYLGDGFSTCLESGADMLMFRGGRGCGA